MSRDTDTTVSELRRLPTGIPGLDTILHGGFLEGGVYIIQGAPGAGKTILSNQACAAHAHAGGKALYVTLLAESHARMLQHLRSLSFFDPKLVPDDVAYVSGFGTLETEGLAGLMTLLRREVRARGTSLVVLDGMVLIEEAAKSDLDYRKFIHELQGYAALEGFVALLLTNNGSKQFHPEHTVVDGLIVMDDTGVGGGSKQSELEVLKFRGSGFLRGRHSFRITADGIQLYPRVEASLSLPLDYVDSRRIADRMLIGIPDIDAMIGGGMPRGATTMLLGPSGIGKTVIGMHFLALSSKEEPGLHFSFYETPDQMIDQAKTIGLDLGAPVDRGDLEMIWQSSTEQILDDLGNRVLEAVSRRKVKRLFIDGLAGWMEAATIDQKPRVGQVFTALMTRLRLQGVTTFYAAETRNISGPDVEIPIGGISTVVESLFLLRYVELHGRLRRLFSVLKVRGVEFDHRLRELLITNQGIQLSDDAFEGAEALTSSFGHSTGTADRPAMPLTDPVSRRGD
jgi:circadian clock protein KaiC